MAAPDRSKGALIDVAGLLLVRALGVLPRRVVLALGATAGRLLCALVPKKRRRMAANLTYAGVLDGRRSAWRAAAHIGRTMTEMAWLLFRPLEDVDGCFEVPRPEVLRDALDEGRGVLLAGAHLGNWELNARAAALSGAPVAAVARVLGTPRIEAAIAGFRTRGGVRTLLRDAPGSSIAAYRTLRSGGILACMMDRVSSGQRIAVPFAGTRTKMPLGPLVLARRSGARIVVVGSRRRPDGIVEVAFDAVPPGPPDETIEELAHRVAAALDALVRAAPDQWYWIYRRPTAHKRRRKTDADEPSRLDSDVAVPA